MFVFKKGKTDQAANQQAQALSDVAASAAAMFLFFAALRAT